MIENDVRKKTDTNISEELLKWNLGWGRESEIRYRLLPVLRTNCSFEEHDKLFGGFSDVICSLYHFVGVETIICDTVQFWRWLATEFEQVVGTVRQHTERG